MRKSSLGIGLGVGWGALVLLSLGLTSCDTLSTVAPEGATNAIAGCPDISSIEAAAKADWAAEFGLDAAVGGKIKGGVVAALELDAFAGRLDADLKAACGGLARDLGASSASFTDGPSACKAAMTAMADIKGKMGASAKIKVAIEPPRCAASMDAMADCVAKCDASVDPGSVKVECEPGKLSGQCDAQCSGTCNVEAGAQCEGTCKGSCDASFSGQCGGGCTGKCDGKKVDGAACAGKCEGSCSAEASGQCGGKCSGACEMKAAGKCEGTCTGECSVEMKAPKCEGEMTPPKASAECNAQCETKVQAEIECTPGRVVVLVDGAADVGAAAKYKAALQKNLPAIVKVAVGMKDQALAVAANARGVVEGVQAAVASVKASPQVGARLSACVAAPFKAAIDAAASVKANVDVSVEVKASASASASASGSAGGSAG